ncbi:MAG: N-acetylmuramoyl-L-alanine amidase [Methanobrevibacter sp.]|nr:N-acetylmuramoyl-L-alanine amidase [Methanobrevibacter sp.]
MIIGLDMGHTLSGAGTGARGYVEETVKNREVGNRLMAMLKEKGHTVINCTVDKSSNDLYDRVRKANAQKLDLFVSLHLNAFKLTTSEMGVETHIYNGNYDGKEANRRYAQAVQTALVQEVKWIDRKVKESNFYVLRETVAPAMLVELGFCDSQGDMNKWNTEKIAAALFRGITGTAYVASAAPVVNTGEGKTFKVGDRVVVSKNATTYATGQDIASWVKGQTYTVQEAKSDRCLLSSIVSWVFNKDLTLEGAPAFQPYIVIVDTDVLNVRTGAGVSYPIATTVKRGQAFTIVEVKDGWGKLKSGAGWISLEYTKKK